MYVPIAASSASEVLVDISVIMEEHLVVWKIEEGYEKGQAAGSLVIL